MKKKFALAIMLFSFFSGLFFVPVNSALAQVQDGGNEYTNYQDPTYEDKLTPCFSFTTGLSIGGCLARFTYFLAYISAWLVSITGQILDYFIAYSIDTASYKGTNNEFIEKGWSIVRDIANIGFIFTLLYIAIKHILQLSGDTKKLIKSLIIAALLINFSLFFTKIIIDAGNILTRAFYNNIEIVNENQEEGVDYKSISQGVASQVQPQRLMSSSLFQVKRTSNGESQYMDNGWAILILGLLTFINVTLALSFLTTFLLFAARVIGLWFMMIFSPIAFLSLALPGTGSFLGQFGWGQWIANTLKLSFMAPIFMFFMFLLVMFLQIVFGSNSTGNQATGVQEIMSVIIPFIAIILIIRMARDQAKEMSGKFGEALVGAVGKLAGITLGAAGLAFGGVAMAGRGLVGATASRFVGSKKLETWASKSSVGRGVKRSTEFLAKTDYDFRNTGASKKTADLLSKSLSAAGLQAGINFGKGTTKGGYIKRMEAYQKKKEDFKEQLKSSDSDKFQTSYVDAAGNTQTVNKSVTQAEADLLRVQNDAKRADTTENIKSATIGNPRENIVKDYEGWVKEREGAEKAQKQAEIDFANVHRNPASTDTQKRAAQTKLTYFTDRHKEVKGVIKNIESSWATEEKEFKLVQKAKNQHDTNMLRNYSESAKLTNLEAIYEIARLRGGMAGRASDAASENIALAAEKAEKKAQAEEKKDAKKT